MTGTLADLSVKIDGAQFYRELRTNHPVYLDPGYQMFVISRYDDVQAVLKQHDVFSNALALFSAYKFEEVVTDILDRTGHGKLQEVLPMTDPPVHTRVRGMVNLAFSAKRIAKIQEFIEKLTDELVDRCIDAGEVDIVSQLAIPLPVTVIGDLLCLPRERWRDVIRWTAAYTACAGNRVASQEQAEQYGHDLAEMQNFIVGHLDERRRNPGDDVLTDLLNAKFEDHAPLTDKEILAISVAFIGAGHETSTVAVTNAVKRLADHPELLEQLRNAEDPNAAARAFAEEVLRLDPPLNAQIRVTTRETEIGGVKIDAYRPVLLLNASANRDERMFGDDSEEFRLNRTNASRHLTFGGGVHVCLGNMLARAELKSVTRAIVNKVERLERINKDIPVEDYHAVIMDWNYRLKKLDVRFTRRK